MAHNRKLLTGGALAVLAVLLVAVILVSNALFRGARLDLTQSHLYTLSNGTRNILGSIDEPIHLYLFYSDKGTQNLPQLRTYAQRVREMLGEMAARAGGKIRLDVIDPLDRQHVHLRAVADQHPLERALGPDRLSQRLDLRAASALRPRLQPLAGP